MFFTGYRGFQGELPVRSHYVKNIMISTGQNFGSWYVVSPSTSPDYTIPYGTKPSCLQTYGLNYKSGAGTGIFSYQGPVVNTKMGPFCPPRKLFPRFAAKFQNRSNYGALYFPFSGVLEGVFFKSIFVTSGTRSGPRRPLWAGIRIGSVQKNPGF